jgi:hypothetical protein
MTNATEIYSSIRLFGMTLNNKEYFTLNIQNDCFNTNLFTVCKSKCLPSKMQRVQRNFKKCIIMQIIAFSFNLPHKVIFRENKNH